MSYQDSSKLGSESSVVLLRRIVKIAESLSVADLGQRQRIVIDAIAAGVTLPAVSAVTSITNVVAQTSLAGMDREMYINQARQVYGNVIRAGLNVKETGGWNVTGPTTLTGPVEITASSTNTLKFVANNIGITQANGAGIWLVNNTPATAGGAAFQQNSPSLVLEGQGWKTNATAESQPVRYSFHVVSIEGSGNPGGRLTIGTSLNNAPYTRIMTIEPSIFVINPDGVPLYFTTGLSGGVQLGSGGAGAEGTLMGFSNYNTNSAVVFRTTNVSSTNISYSVTITTGTTVDGGSGPVFVASGLPSGSGIQGNVIFGTTNTGTDMQSMSNGYYVRNVVAVPSADPATGYFTWASIEPEGSNQKIRTSGGHFAKPTLQRKVTIAGGAILRAIGGTPQTIIAAPGASKYLNIIKVTVSYKYGTTAYDFGAGAYPLFRVGTGNRAAWTAVSQINSGSDYNIVLDDAATLHTVGGFVSPTNTALTLTTDNGGNATTGDGDWDIVVYYTIEDVNA
jgi:hypothetical protein